MKIGIYHDQTIPTRGGGYVLKQEILQSLGSTNLPKNMKLVFFSWEDSHSLSKISSNHSKLIYNESLDFRIKLALRGWFSQLCIRSFFQDIIMLIKGKYDDIYHKYLNISGISYIRKNIFEKQLKSEKIDFLLFLEPWEVFTSNSLYVCINWDLAHYEDLYFPEIIQTWNQVSQSKIHAIQKAMRVINGTNVLSKQVNLHAHVPMERLRVLPFPTPKDALTYACSSKTTKTGALLQGLRSPYLFYPACYCPHKNHALLIKALKVLNKDNFFCDLVFCGADKGNRDFIYKMTKELELNDQVHFCDFLKREEVLDLYFHAEALVFPSLIGPDNIPPLEAFAIGCPVIAGELSGAIEQLGDAAYLFNPLDLNDLINAIKSLRIDQNIWKKRIEKGRQRAMSWTAKNYTEGLFTVFNELEPYFDCCETHSFNPNFS